MTSKQEKQQEQPERHDEDRHRKNADRVDAKEKPCPSVYGAPFDHNEWLGVLTSSGFFV